MCVYQSLDPRIKVWMHVDLMLMDFTGNAPNMWRFARRYHKWLYFPRMTKDEAILLKTWDSTGSDFEGFEGCRF